MFATVLICTRWFPKIFVEFARWTRDGLDLRALRMMLSRAPCMDAFGSFYKRARELSTEMSITYNCDTVSVRMSVIRLANFLLYSCLYTFCFPSSWPMLWTVDLQRAVGKEGGSWEDAMWLRKQCETSDWEKSVADALLLLHTVNGRDKWKKWRM